MKMDEVSLFLSFALNPITSSNCTLSRDQFLLLLDSSYQHFTKSNQNKLKQKDLNPLLISHVLQLYTISLLCISLLRISVDFIYFFYFISYSLFNTFEFLFLPLHWNSSCQVSCSCQVTSVLPDPVDTSLLSSYVFSQQYSTQFITPSLIFFSRAPFFLLLEIPSSLDLL